MGAKTRARDWRPPDVFDEYRVVEEIGSGAMGRVYLAHDRLLDRPVAIKFAILHTFDPMVHDRFLREARAAARLQHPNVISIYRIGELERRPYLVTEYLRGQNLRSLTFPLASDRALAIVIDLCRGLSAAHRQGVLHRDIKPANAFICEDQTAKLLDFGLATFDHDPEETFETGRSGSLDEPGWNAENGDSDEGTVGSQSLEESWKHPKYQLTAPGALMGTPHFMAPELWRGHPASRASDVYAMGALMRVLFVGKPPFANLHPGDLSLQSELGWNVAPTSEVGPDIPRELAGIIDRCLLEAPEERYATGDALRDALEALRREDGQTNMLSGNPYRGLRAFEAEHQCLFFGRAGETRTVIERLRAESLVVVAGDSGVGKSSLCRAGVIPRVLAGSLDGHRTWGVIKLIPGRHPLQALIAGLAMSLDFPEANLRSLITSNRAATSWFLRKKLGDQNGRLLFVDQFEEMVTIADRDEAEAAANILVLLTIGLPGFRVLATVRGDFLTRVAQIPSLGDELMRALYILRPLAPEALREAIVGPASARGVSFDEDVVSELVDAGRDGSLPLLQFSLAEVWENRVETKGSICRTDLEQIGGVEGALSRHADNVLHAMLPAQRRAARALFSRLVSIEKTRASLPEEELTAGDPDMRGALEQLVRGRLLVIRETEAEPVYEIAHEALISGWGSLTRWLDQAQEQRLCRDNLERAAVQWHKRGRLQEMLWGPSQLEAASQLDNLRDTEREFLRHSRRHLVVQRRLRTGVLVTVPLLLLGTIVAVQLWNAWLVRRELDEQLVEGARQMVAVKDETQRLARLRQDAYDTFDTGDYEGGKERWERVKKAEKQYSMHLSELHQLLAGALDLDPKSEPTREYLAQTLYLRAQLAESLYQQEQVHDYLEAVKRFDHDGSIYGQWQQPAKLTIVTRPAEASVSLERYVTTAEGRRDPTEVDIPAAKADASVTFSLAPGSYRVRVQREGFTEVLAPVNLTRGEVYSLDLELPRIGDVPENYLYVPAGRFLFGSPDASLWSVFLNSTPIHPMETEAFLIAKHETTYAEWIAFLEALPADQRQQHLAGLGAMGESITLRKLRPGRWELRIIARDRDDLAVSGGKIRNQFWEQFPVTGIRPTSVEDYMAWLRRTGRVPGARLCTDFEWERAARGADDRVFPHGDSCSPMDFNYDSTRGNDVTPGPFAVGSFSRSESPFGAHDMVGNAYEFVQATFGDQAYAARGGAWKFEELTATIPNREPVPRDFQAPSAGFRVCASLPESGRAESNGPSS